MKKFTLQILLIAACVFTVNTGKANTDSLALVDLFNSTNGQQWTNHQNWLTKNPISTWYGVYTYIGYVQGIKLPSNNLAGSIPSSLGNISGLASLDLSNNLLTGKIPSDLGKLTNLINLNLSNNLLTGAIPKSLGSIYHQYSFNTIILSNNKLSDSIPASFSNLKNLVSLDLSHNHLSGNIPSFLGALTQLGYLDISNNILNNSLPSELGNLHYLNTLNLSYNQLNGSIPLSFGNLSYLISLSLNNNLLSGGIPASLGDLKMLYVLDLSHNQLTGNIPSQLDSIPQLQQLRLSYNLFSSCSASFTTNYLYSLNLDHNQLSGNLSIGVNGVGNFYLWRVDLSNNLYSGEIPTSGFLNNLTPVRYLYLDSNQLSGNIPAELGNHAQIIELNLSDNQLSGNIPSSFSNFVYAEVINLKKNNLSDSIPSGLGNLHRLKRLQLSFNNFTGNIPSSFINLKKLRTLNVNYNLLSGTLPSFLDTLHSLKRLIILNNYYNFDGLEQLVQQNNLDTLKYKRQRLIDIHQDGGTLSVYAGGTLSNNTYRWFRNGKLVATLYGDSAFHPTENGNYRVDVTNKIATELTLHSNTFNVLNVRSVLSENSSSLKITDKNSFLIYPNPAQTIATVSFKAKGKYIMYLSDVNGKLVQTVTGVSNSGDNHVRLKLNGLAKGTYVVTIIDENKNKQSLKLEKS